MITARDFLVRGLLAGLVAGFLAFGVAYAVGEPSIATAIALEEAAAAQGPGSGTAAPGHEGEPAAGHTHGEEEDGTEVPRALQSTLGLLTGTTVIGIVLGGLAGMVTALALGRLGGLSARATALRVAAAGFIVLYAVPFLIYPPNPPAVGSAETIGERTRLYFAMVAISVVSATVAAIAGRRLQNQLGGWYASLVATGGYLAAMAIAVTLMPRYNEVGPDFPAHVLFEFRIGSMLTQAALWTVLGVVLAELVHRLVAPGPSRNHGPGPAAGLGLDRYGRPGGAATDPQRPAHWPPRSRSRPVIALARPGTHTDSSATTH